MRDKYWDIMKALAILSVVIGHAQILNDKISWFELQIFFFVSGFLFNAQKCLNYGEFFLHKLSTLWKPMILYNTVFLFLHDFFIKIHWISLQQQPFIEWYNIMISSWISIYEIPRHFFLALFNGMVDVMCGPLWFMAWFFSNILLFGCLVKYSHNKPAYTLPVLTLLFFVAGIAIDKHVPGIVMYVDKALLMLPITAMGFYLKKLCYSENLHVTELVSKYKIKSAICLSFFMSVFFLSISHSEFVYELVKGGGARYLLIIILQLSGICFTMVLAWIVMYVEQLKTFFAFIGSESFHIMALHFVGFKILTSICTIFSGKDR